MRDVCQSGCWIEYKRRYYINTKEIILKNGSKVLYTRKPSDNFFSISIGFNVGKIHENDSNRGISHLLEHMCFNGTKKYSKEDFIGMIDVYGGGYNAYTSDDTTCYQAQGFKEYGKEIVDWISQLCFYPSLSEEYLEKEKKIVIEELKQDKDDSFAIAWQLSDSACFNNRYSSPIIGYEEIINKITESELQEYFKTNYNTNNMIISVCTDMGEDELIEILEEYIPFVDGNECSRLSVVEFKDTVIKEKDSIEHNVLIHRMSFDSKYKYVANLFNKIYGDGMNSKLFQELRENKSLCYQVGAFTTTFSDVDELISYISFSETDKKGLIIENIGSIIEDMYHITEEELNVAKTLVKKDIYTTMESSMNISKRVLKRHFEDKVIDFYDTIDVYEDITLDDVSNFTESLVRSIGNNGHSVAWLKAV